jgi:hypothetical protein
MGFILKTSFQPTSGFLNLNVSTAPTGYSVNYALIAGGGGAIRGGAGGGGGVLQGSQNLNSSTLYNIAVGNGGVQSNGQASLAFGNFAYGGGAGGAQDQNGSSGGSGGSGDYSNVTTFGGAGISGQGYAGGGNNGFYGPFYPTGGGGGAGGVGNNAVNATTSGNGGIGVAITIGGYSAGNFAGGGGGAIYNSITGYGTGSYGGGNGGYALSRNGVSGTANTGGGGGGAALNGVGGSGGSGEILLSIPTASYPGDTYVNGGVVDNSVWTKTTSGSNTILTFKKSSTYASSAGSPSSFSYAINSLAIGGGGGGSDDNSSGGGSGGYVVTTSLSATTGTTYTINVGLGGQHTQWNTNNTNNNVTSEATDGLPSTIKVGATTLATANGGVNGVTNTPFGGYGGGNVNPPTDDPNQNASSPKLLGGIGIASSITGVPTYYAGGGSGYDFDAGQSYPNGAGVIGQGGNGGSHGNGWYAGNGSNGAVILSMPILNYTGKTTGNPLVSYDSTGNKVILTFNNAGTYIA